MKNRKLTTPLGQISYRSEVAVATIHFALGLLRKFETLVGPSDTIFLKKI